MKTNKKTEENNTPEENFRSQSREIHEKKDKKSTKNTLIYALTVVVLVVIVVTFIGTPAVGGMMGGGERVVFGRWLNKPINFYPGSYFSEQIEELTRGMDRRNIDRTNPLLQRQLTLQVWRGAFERTVIHTAILRMLDKSSVTVSNAKIDRMLISHGPYLGPDGEFSITRYMNTPVTERNRHRQAVREAILREIFLNDFFHGIKTSQNEKDFIASMGKNEVTLDIAYISFNDFPENEVISFARENMDLFRSAGLSKITVFSSRRNAERIHSMVSSNPDSFRDVAINQSVDSFASIGGDMGRVFKHELRLELRNNSDADKVFALSRGEISPVLETSNNGWVIYKCNSDPHDFDLAAADSINIVRNYMAFHELGIIEDYFLRRAMRVRDAVDFRNAAAINNFTIHRTAPFPINFRNHNLFNRIEIENAPPDLRGFSFNQELLETAFSLRENEISNPITLGNSVVLLSLVARSENHDFSDTVHSLWPRISQQTSEQSLTSFIFNPDRFEDNFRAAFDRHVVNE
ncbi:MAG: peptidylprolyl isomerase [Spirochaetes bacterium]|nr:peptidylprolyl isomerase [Spirochaetota bacterium]